jgi:DNA polymerase elongation subunit (family B)
MIIPFGEIVFCYDVNSLYPSVMHNQLFPIGDIIKFNGDISLLKNEFYWFAEVEVSTKKDLKIPYLQIRYNNRTVSPNGTFKMIINSSEYFNGLKDYNFKILNGYAFKQQNIFYNFVNDLYTLRQKYSKADPMNLIAKLLMNSLYGRFGMKPIINIQTFIERNQLDKIKNKFEINELIDLDNDGFFISYLDPLLIEEEQKSSNGIASAVTAYSRVHMQEIKQYCINNGIKIYYFDTDSIFTDKPLPSWMISNKLGSLKLEYIFKEAVFLGPKIYAGITTDNNYICKIKGFKDSKDIPFNDMKSLLKENASLNLQHNKWFRNLSEAQIFIKDSPYQLTPTQNKRKIIYKDGIAVNTVPFKIE